MFKRLTETFRSSSRNTVRRPAKDARLAFQSLEDRRMLAVITVTSLADNLIPGSGVTLREAVQAANTDTSVDGSVAGSGDDTIVFDASLAGQTILLGTELEIDETLTIDATALANDVTIDANEMSRIFNITATTGDFQFNGLTLTGGKTIGDNVDFSDKTYSGGALRSLTTGNLTLDDSTITGNSTAGIRADGGGVFAVGNVTLTNSAISGNSTARSDAHGGGVRAGGNFTLTGSTVSGNSTTGNYADGGGVYAYGNVTLMGSTVSGNSTTGTFGLNGGGVHAVGDVTLTNSTVSGNSTTGIAGSNGGGVYAVGDVTLTNSTVSGNSAADFGGISAGGDVTLYLSTVTRNYASAFSSSMGGISTNGTLLIDDSIVAGNTANHFGTGGFMINTDVRLSGDGTFTANFSLLGMYVTPDAGGSSNVISDFPMLGSLQDNGGPTETHALLPGSPAIDAGNPLVTTPYDQRGEPFTRIVDGRVDIGAYESALFVVTTTTDEFDVSNTDVSLREAISTANGSIGTDTITFAASLSGGTIDLTDFSLGELEITEAVTIDATALAANVTIDANENSRIFNITATTGDFQFNGLTLTGGITEDNNVDSFDNTHSGGALRSLTTGNLAFDGSTITGNSTAGTYANGGGVFARGNVTLTGSTVSGNSTSGGRDPGGGVYASGNVTLTGSTVSGNSTAGEFASGGGVFASGNVILSNSTVSGNSTSGSSADGGGVRANGDVTLILSTVTNNEATDATSTGGGIWNNNDTILIDGSIVAGNTAGGGMIDIDPGTGTFSVNYSLIGSGVTPDAGTSGNNVVADNPLLGPLADNGGLTLTRALLPGSPAIDAGNNALAVDANGNPLITDQRGTGFGRFVDGDSNGTATVDIGAFEAASAVLLGDVDQNGVVNFLDINPFIDVLSANGFQAEADIDESGTVDFLDIDPFIVLLSSPPSGAASASLSAAPSESALQTTAGISVQLSAVSSEPAWQSLQISDGVSVQSFAESSEPSLLSFVGGSQVQNWNESHDFRNEVPLRNSRSAAMLLSHRKADRLAQQERSYDIGSQATSHLDASSEPAIATSSADLFDAHPELLDDLQDFQLDEIFAGLLYMN